MSEAITTNDNVESKPATPAADYGEISKNGLWTNNPALVQLLGLCPLLAVSGSVVNALGCHQTPCLCDDYCLVHDRHSIINAGLYLRALSNFRNFYSADCHQLCDSRSRRCLRHFWWQSYRPVPLLLPVF